MPHQWLLLGPSDTGHRLCLKMFIGDGMMVYAEQM